ncbi:hypothetical protein [Methylobrevis pamukkalensis]|uniref:Uncharacterized protein n=1 Tax=Methylobrevis pamukkalensis TaxID=1439726 RepID=A0A1E3H0G8_9HYPH|nr:hypothetical protein [Methylobrevis pamukkalensis]ODN69784.1 hypothetical protein A6302_02906 [Methylobrevis pamukkalensis]
MVDRDGRLASASGRLSAGRIELAEGEDVDVLLERGQIDVRWDPSDRAIVISPSYASFPAGSALMSGRVHPPASEDVRWRYALSLTASDGTPGAAGRRGGARLSGSYDPAAGQFAIDSLVVDDEQTRFSAALSMSHHSRAPCWGCRGLPSASRSTS